MFTDTDSLCYEISTDDLYADMKVDSHRFDFSGYPKTHPLFDSTNKKVLGKMKDETESVPPEEFVGLRSKMYSLLCGGTEKKTAKGISKTVIKKHLRHDLYRSCLGESRYMISRMTQIRSEYHQVYTIDVNKVSLSPYDDKRYVLEDGVHTLAYGHYEIS